MSDSLLSRVRSKLERELLEIEHRTDLTDDQKADRIVVMFATGCAGIAVQPIPFADFFILTPLQAFMGTRLAAIRGVRLSEQESTDVLKQLMSVVGVVVVAQELGRAAARVLFPIFGGVATVPVVFGLTYAIGTVMDKFFVYKAAGRTLSKDQIRGIWKDAKRKGKEQGKQREASIKRDTDETR